MYRCMCINDRQFSRDIKFRINERRRRKKIKKYKRRKVTAIQGEGGQVQGRLTSRMILAFNNDNKSYPSPSKYRNKK